MSSNPHKNIQNCDLLSNLYCLSLLRIKPWYLIFEKKKKNRNRPVHIRSSPLPASQRAEVDAVLQADLSPDCPDILLTVHFTSSLTSQHRVSRRYSLNQVRPYSVQQSRCVMKTWQLWWLTMAPACARLDLLEMTLPELSSPPSSVAPDTRRVSWPD